MKTNNKISSRSDIQGASREELVLYLEGWGFQCYDSESTDELREAALQNWDTESHTDEESS